MCQLGEEMGALRGPAWRCRRLPRLSIMLAHKANTHAGALVDPAAVAGLLPPLCASHPARAAIRLRSGGDLSQRASEHGIGERASQHPSSPFCCSGNLRRISTDSLLCRLLIFCNRSPSLL